MGFGHRVYMKKMDPRAVIMKKALKLLCDASGDDLLIPECVKLVKINGKRERSFIRTWIIMRHLSTRC